MFSRQPKLTPEEQARALGAVLRDLEPEAQREAEALLDRMTSKDRARIERVLIKQGATSWPRLEGIMLKFGELAPPSSKPAGESAAAAPHQPSPSANALSPEHLKQREQANRALGR